jgi:outer membrane protein TolC
MRKLPIIALWVAITGLADAQTAPQTLTLNQAVAIAIQNHPQIAVAQNVEAAAGQRVTEARAPYYPVVNGEATASQARGRVWSSIS